MNFLEIFFGLGRIFLKTTTFLIFFGRGRIFLITFFGRGRNVFSLGRPKLMDTVPGLPGLPRAGTVPVGLGATGTGGGGGGGTGAEVGRAHKLVDSPGNAAHTKPEQQEPNATPHASFSLPQFVGAGEGGSVGGGGTGAEVGRAQKLADSPGNVEHTKPEQQGPFNPPHASSSLAQFVGAGEGGSVGGGGTGAEVGRAQKLADSPGNVEHTKPGQQEPNPTPHASFPLAQFVGAGEDGSVGGETLRGSAGRIQS